MSARGTSRFGPASPSLPVEEGPGDDPTEHEAADVRDERLHRNDGLDAVEGATDVIVLAATNRPDVLDPALLRPGRFDRRVTINPPDKDGREQILRVHTRPIPLAPDVDIDALASTTVGMVGADLAKLANEAALLAARRKHSAC